MITAIQSAPAAAISELIAPFRRGAGGRGFKPAGAGREVQDHLASSSAHVALVSVELLEDGDLPTRWGPLLVLTPLVLVLGRSIAIDDTLFLGAAEQILKDPWRPFDAVTPSGTTPCHSGSRSRIRQVSPDGGPGATNLSAAPQTSQRGGGGQWRFAWTTPSCRQTTSWPPRSSSPRSSV